MSPPIKCFALANTFGEFPKHIIGGCIAIFLHRESALQPQVQVSES